MEAISAMVSTLASAAAAAAPTAAAAAAPAQQHPTFTASFLGSLMHTLLTGDTTTRSQALSQYYASNVEFSLNDGALRLSGRDSLGQLLSGLALLVDTEAEVLDVAAGPDRAVLLINLRLAFVLAPWTWARLTRVQVPTTITLDFGALRGAPLLGALLAEDVILGHHQALSLPDLLVWPPVGPWLRRSTLWGPLSGRFLSAVMQVRDRALLAAADAPAGDRTCGSEPAAAAKAPAAAGTEDSAGAGAMASKLEAAAAGARQQQLPRQMQQEE